MASIRRGYSDDFTLKNNNVGIGTSTGQEALDVVDGVVKGQDLKVTGISSFTAYEGFLRADQQIAENTTLSFDQGPSASLSGEIIVGTGVTTTIASVGLGTTTVGNGSGTITNTIETTDVTRAGGSEIECLKVYDTFTPPSGGTNERPYAPKPGELYYNYDFKTIEFFDGYGWRQVDNTTRSGRGVFGGGRVPGNSAIIDYIQIMSTGNAINFGDLLVARTDAASFSNELRGIWAGGKAPSVSTHIDYVTLASRGNGVDFGDVTPAAMGGSGAGASSNTRGVFALGQAPAASDALHYVQIMTTGNSVDFGDLTGNLSEGAACGSPTRGLFNKGTGSTGIDVVTIASTGNAIEFGEDSMGRTDQQRGCGSCSNSVRGLFASGGAGTAQTDNNAIRYVTIATNGNAIDFGDRTIITRLVTAAATSTRATFAAGIDSGGTNFNNIDYVTISTTGNALDFGDLTDAFHAHGGCSDSHGGLGGF